MNSKSQLAGAVAAMASNWPLFKYRSDQDYRDATQVIAEVDQGGLGLPDRDYYLKDDAKSEELRKAYVGARREDARASGRLAGGGGRSRRR